MADGQRIYPVNRLVLHHSVGPDFKDVAHDTIAKWYSDIGQNRGYAGITVTNHTYKGVKTFAQAQYAGHWHSGKYCIFEIMDDPWNNVAWHAGNWSINQQSIGIENCGNYLDVAFNDAQRQAVANFWRPQDKKLAGNTYINGHSDFSATACPARIKDAIPTIVNYINNPPVVPAPTPPPAPADPCKAYKDEIVRLKADLVKTDKVIVTMKNEVMVLNETVSALKVTTTTQGEVIQKQDATITELLAKNEQLKQELADCDDGKGCQVVQSMGWIEILKCKLGVKK